MTPCRKRVLRIFGLLTLLVLLVPPYREIRINRYQERGSVLVRRVTTGGRGFMLLPQFLKLRGQSISGKSREERRISLNESMFFSELGVVAILGLFDYFVLCSFRKRPVKQKK
jgi:hypothetical protein